jgi:hypothetical protein
MKKVLKHLMTGLLCMQSNFGFSQITENFSDSNYSQNPRWICSESTDWIINNQLQLQSNRNVNNSNCWISTSQSLADSVQWEIDIQLAFNPSSLNFLDVYLMCSDSVPVSPTATGYFIRIGNTDDEIALYRKDEGNKIIKLIDGVNGMLNKNDNRYRIKINRRNKSQWNLWYDETMSGEKYVKAGVTTDSIYQESKYFSVFIQQSTASFFQKHFIDNIYIGAYLPDIMAPSVRAIEIIGPQKIRVQFNESIPPLAAFKKENYHINNAIEHPGVIIQDSLSANGYLLLLDKPMLSGNNYQLHIVNIYDDAGNRMNDTIIPLFFNIPKQGDIIINELLFNPIGNGSDYIEIMNRSAYPINIKGFSLDNRSSTGTSTNKKTLFSENYVMGSGEILVFCDNRQNILSSFFVKKPQQLIELSSLPSLPNENGNIRLLNAEGLIWDELQYDEKWHYPLLNQREGVALERINPSALTQNMENWNSASKSSGYGTPTTQNSQSQMAKETNTEISLSSRLFSPDQDGNDDVLLIQYSFPEGGYLLNCTIFDRMGRPVRSLQRNMLCGISGQFKWDGLDEQSRELPMGHYIIFTEVFSLKGTVKKFKNEIVLARRK